MKKTEDKRSRPLTYAISSGEGLHKYNSPKWLSFIKRPLKHRKILACPKKIGLLYVVSIIVALLFLILFTGLTAAQTPTSVESGDMTTWILANGPYESEVISLAIDPGDVNSIYAVTNGGGVFKSSDGGTNWRAINEGLTNLYIQTLAIAPDDSNTLYVGTNGSGVFKSSDGGASWKAVNTGMPAGIVLFIAFDPQDSDVLYTGMYDSGVFKSNDKGATWKAINEGLTDLKVQTLAFDPEDSSILYVGTNGSGVFKSSDGGASWRATEGLTGLNVKALALDHQDSSILYAATTSGVFKSSDGGVIWRTVNGSLTDLNVQTLALDPQNSDILYAGTYGSGVFKSSDGGASWKAINEGLTADKIRFLVITPHDSSTLHAGTYGSGVFKSSDGGASWKAVSESLTELALNTVSLASDLGDGSILYVGTDGSGVFKSNDGGTSWRAISQGFTDLSNIQTLALDPQNNNILYAGTYRGRIFKSNDGGANWRAVGEGLLKSTKDSTEPRVQALAFDPQDSDVLYAGIYGHGVYKSNDGGMNWKVLNEELIWWCADHPSFKLCPVLYIQALTLDPQDTGTLYAGTNGGGVFKSSDGGASWEPINEGLTDLNVKVLALAPQDSSILYAGTERGAVFKSTDGGMTWESKFSGSILSIIIVIINDSQVICVGTPRGAFTSVDGGTTWRNAGLGDVSINEFALGPKNGEDRTLYAGTTRGVYRGVLDLSKLHLPWWQGNATLAAIGFTSIITLGTFFYLSVVYPNRLRPTTVLWLLPHPRHILAAPAYRAYMKRWAAGDALEQLILLQAPMDAPFAPTQLETELRQLGAAFDAEGLLAALSALAQRELLVREKNGSWRLTEPLLAQLQRQEISRKEPARLAEQTRQEHPLYAEARRFLAQAGFTVRPADPFGLLCASDLPVWTDVSPLYVRLALERTLDLEEFQSLCVAAEMAYDRVLRGHTAVVVIDRPPRAGDLHQIFALHAQRGLTIIPLPRSLMIQARQDGREMEALREQVSLYTGRTDLYGISRAAVTDVLSFFGRSGLLADLGRRLTAGRSAVIFGVRKMGKSSVLGRLREECPWPVALVDLEGYAGSLGYVYEEALRGWRAALRATFPDLPFHEWTDDLATLDPAAQAQAFRRAVADLLDWLAARPGRPGLLLFLDEIDTLFDRPEYPEFAAVLRSVAEDPRCRGRFALLAAGLEPTLNQVDWMDGERNPFYAFFGEIPLWLLKPEDTRTMVVSIGGQMGISYEDKALDLLVEVGGGHPFLTRQLCSQAVRDLERPGTVDLGRAARAVEDYLRLAHNYFADSLWGLDSGGPSPVEAALLRSLATIQPQPEESLISPNLSLEERRARQLALDHLHNQSLIRPVEKRWELTIPLYRRWIRRYILSLSDEVAEEGDR